MEDLYIDRVLSGDIDAFGYFIGTYKDMAYNISFSIVKDEQYAEEIVQDAFMKAFNGLRAFNREATFKSWFYRIVVNESFLRLRSLKKDRAMLSIEEQSELMAKELFNEIPENHTDAIDKVLSKLSAKESLALELFYLQELSIDDVTQITGWTKANTKVILHRARKNLRRIWIKN